MASAPAMMVADSRPSAMSVAARLTSHCGVFPPMVVTSHRAVGVPIRAGQLGGRGRSRPGHDVDHREAVDRSRSPGT